MVVLLGVVTVLSVLQILSFTLQGFIGALVYGLIYGYVFVTIYSLYDMLREERENGGNGHYQPALIGKA